MRSILPNSQTGALAMAMAGAALAAVTTMFLPVTLFEGVAGSSGLTELIPSARAPLGDTARALIAFATGAMTLAVLSYLLLRAESVVARPNTNDVGMGGAAAQTGGNMADTSRARPSTLKQSPRLGGILRVKTGSVVDSASTCSTSIPA